MEISLFDIILINTTTYLFGIATGLLFCCKYKDRITRSRSLEDLSRYNHHNNNNNTIYPPESNIIVASAPPPPPSQPSHNPVKLTIE